MEMQIREGLEDQVIPIVLHGGAGILFRQGRIDALNDAVPGDQIPARRDVQLPQGRGGDDGSFDDCQ